jgi:hypothetical protein
LDHRHNLLETHIIRYNGRSPRKSIRSQKTKICKGRNTTSKLGSLLCRGFD